MKNKLYWDGIINSVNTLMGILNRKPRQFKLGYQCSPGAILNAYREGDATFDEAVAQLEAWKDRQMSLAELTKLGAIKLSVAKLTVLLNRSFEELELSVRAYNSVKNTGICTIGDLVQKTEQELLRKHRLNRRVVKEVKEVLESLGLTFGLEIKDGRIVQPGTKSIEE